MKCTTIFSSLLFTTNCIHPLHSNVTFCSIYLSVLHFSITLDFEVFFLIRIGFIPSLTVIWSFLTFLSLLTICYDLCFLLLAVLFLSYWLLRPNVMTTLQEIISIYRDLSPPVLSIDAAKRVSDALTLFQVSYSTNSLV